MTTEATEPIAHPGQAEIELAAVLHALSDPVRLHVADASIIPRSPHVSPHLTVLALAERMAELLG